MHTTAHIVLEDVLIACNTVHLLGHQLTDLLEHQQTIKLTPQEKDELTRAFQLMRMTMDCVAPLVNFQVITRQAAAGLEG